MIQKRKTHRNQQDSQWNSNKKVLDAFLHWSKVRNLWFHWAKTEDFLKFESQSEENALSNNECQGPSIIYVDTKNDQNRVVPPRGHFITRGRGLKTRKVDKIQVPLTPLRPRGSWMVPNWVWAIELVCGQRVLGIMSPHARTLCSYPWNPAPHQGFFTNNFGWLTSRTDSLAVNLEAITTPW